MLTYKLLLEEANAKLINNDLAENAAQLLLLDALNIEPHQLYMMKEQNVDTDTLNKFETNLLRAMQDEPIQHILGYQYFYGNRIKVNPNVLIPRGETEELVEQTINLYHRYFHEQENTYVCDMCTGSGAIAIALKKELPNLNIYASDISKEALDVAHINAQNNQTTLSFLKGDLLEPLIERNIKLDILVANPPYIATNEELTDSVIKYEPKLALYAGTQGLDIYEKLLLNIKKVINNKALIIMEIGYKQGKLIQELASKYFPTKEITIIKDLENKDRMVIIKHNLENITDKLM
ncbi:MAG: peptide chain release factor N(5)-glutamine methyltransferase [Erysipelotrichaceae bacterium]